MQKIIEELKDIPEDQLLIIYQFIHTLRLEVDQENQIPRMPGLLKGKLGEAFFEPLPEEELKQWEQDI